MNIINKRYFTTYGSGVVCKEERIGEVSNVRTIFRDSVNSWWRRLVGERFSSCKKKV